MTTVTGILRDAQQNAIPNAGVTVRYTRALVGFEGGAVAQNDRLFTTDGSGELVMADLIPGHYDVFVSMPVNANTSQAVVKRGTGTVPTGEASISWEAFLQEPIGQVDSTVLQQAVAAAQDAEAAKDDAEAAAATAVSAAAGVEFPVSYAPQVLDAGQKAQARTNLGLGTAAVQPDDRYAHRANNLSDIADAGTARTNLGLGTAAVADIVGTVSQSAGVPTGAIIQRGSNSNGEFVRYADGTQICWNPAYDGGANRNEPIDDLWRTALQSWTYPAVFSELPTLTLSSGGTTTWSGSTSTSNSAGNYRQFSTRSFSSSVAVRISAIGRWF